MAQGNISGSGVNPNDNQSLSENVAVFKAPGGGNNSIGTPDWSLGELLLNSSLNEYLSPHFVSIGTIGSYKIFICNDQGSKDIFDNFKRGYKIEITLSAREYLFNGKPSTFDGHINVEFKVGYLNSIIKKIRVTPFDDFNKITFFYQPTDFDLRKPEAKNMWLRKLTPGVLKIVDSKVESLPINYEEFLNNSIFEDTSYVGNYFPIPSVSNGKTLLTNIGDKFGNTISLKFGNGQFKRGIWKTGVWNDGFRSTWDGVDDIYYFDKINNGTFQLSQNMWMLKIDCNTNPDNVNNIVDNLFVNDFVSISNVVGIDINDERYLLKDYYRISSITTTSATITITLEIPIAKFPLRRFEIDSINHLIYVTKNIWLGGTFLNGVFRGIWNFGLFKGFPYTTIMTDSHFVDGTFDGGRFISKITSITSSTSIVKQYHTGLVQFFEFYDNNISETEGFSEFIDNTYQSWIDVNYYTQSFVNLNSLTSIYDDNFGKKVPIPNLYGYPTLDILSSYSKFKNTNDNDVDFYSLGTKYKIFTDHLGENGYFRNPFNNQGRPGIDEFINSGWTANTGNFYGTPTVSFIYNSNITRRNVNRISITLATFGYNVLNNRNILVGDKKYSIVEYDLEYFQRGFDVNTGEFTNSFAKPLNLLGSNYPSTTNIFRNNIIKTEYFFNKNALDLILRYNSEYIPPSETLSMYGFNYTHSSVSPNGETNPSYSTTYSFILPQSPTAYSGLDFIPDFEEGGLYNKYDIVRRFSADVLAPYFISLKSNNSSPLTDRTSWRQTTVGYNNPIFENSIFEQSEIFDFFTSVRINYFKFLEVDSLPFFKYWDYEINFSSTFKDGIYLGLEFSKPHGFKAGDFVEIKLDETKFNPNYEQSNVRILSIQDGPLKSRGRAGDVAYTVKLDLPYGNTVSYLSESGTVRKVGERIDKRIQTNYSSISPKVEGLDENYVYLGNNQVYVDRNSFNLSSD